MTELTRQQRRDRLARRIGKVYLYALPFVGAGFVTSFVGWFWVTVVVMLVGGGLMLSGGVMLATWYIGALFPDDWVNEWFD